MSALRSNPPRALFVADPGSSAELVKIAKSFLARGAGIAGYSAYGEDVATSDANLTAMVDDPEVDLLVVLRSQPAPCHQILTAIAAARQSGKPVHALFNRGVAPTVDADEAHMIALDRRWETERDLCDWGDSLPRRFGRMT